MTWPQPLEPVSGPFSASRIDGAAEGMGAHGPATRGLIDEGIVPPDLLCGMTLFLLARQPRSNRSSQGQKADRPKASAIAGGVWVREQFTMHRPLERTDSFTVSGDATGRFVRKGRRYGITRSQSHDSEGRPVATNLTNGLLSYKAEKGLSDQAEGLALEQTPVPEPDHGAAANNPHLDRIRAARVGQPFGGGELTISLAMMAARDTANPDNPIHSDLDAAREAGLARPIAGGSHVLAFALEPLVAAWGPGSLHHGSKLDLRWKAPTEAGAAIIPTATVSAVEPDRVVVDLEVRLGAGPTALVGVLTVPLAP